MSKKVTIYTDGACSGNPGVGAWAAILFYGEASKSFSELCQNTTNNRMELLGAINALKQLKEPCEVTLYSDSAYLINAFIEGWIYGWKAKGWQRGNKELLNKDLWQELYDLNKTHKIIWTKVKGHSNNQYNNECDKLATDEIKKYKKEQKLSEIEE